MKLGEILLQKNILSDSQLVQVINKQPQSQKKLGEILLDEQIISNEDLHQALQEQYWRRNGFWIIG